MADVLVISGQPNAAGEAIVLGLRQLGIDARWASLDRQDDSSPSVNRLARAPEVAEPVSRLLSREIEQAPLKPRYCLLFVAERSLRVPAFLWLLKNLACVVAEKEQQIFLVVESPDLARRLDQTRLKSRKIFLLSERTATEVATHVEALPSFALSVNWSFGKDMGKPLLSFTNRRRFGVARDLPQAEEEGRRQRWEEFDAYKRLKYERGDATAFARRKFQRGSAELIRIVVHGASDAKDVARAARLADRKSAMAGKSAALGLIRFGIPVTVALDIAGGECGSALQTLVWNGRPLEFSFPVSVSPIRSVKTVAVVARILLEGAQVGTIGFTRPVSGGFWIGGKSESGERLRRVNRVFLSYASADRDEVILIASAYRRVGINCFFDRVSLRPGEEWHPRLLDEIERADLFHLFWSQSASKSQWVEREAVHAITRRKKSTTNLPDITLQMLDGPPWAPHPQSLASLNFDDFERAAIVGYRSASAQ